MNNATSRKITTWVRKVVVLVLAGLILYQPAFAAHIPITFEEEDGSPSIANIKKIQVPNNKLTSLGNGNLLLDLNGDITAAAAFTDNRMIRADGTAGVQDSGITIDDTDNITGVLGFTATGTIQGAVVNGSSLTADLLTVTGASTLTGAVTVTGNATVSGTVQGAVVNGTSLTGDALTITGATSLTGSTTMTGAATVSANFTVDSSTLFVDSAANTVSLGTTSSAALFTVNGITAMADGQSTPAANANFGKIYVKNDNLYYLPASGSATEFLLNNGAIATPGADTEVVFNDGGALGAEAAFNYDKTTDTLQAININGDALTADALTITGASSFTGAVTVTGNATVSGTVQGAVVNGTSLTGDALTVTGASSLTGAVTVVGNSTLTGTVGITGATTINGNTSVIGNATVSGTVQGAVVNGTSLTGDALTITGATSLTGATTMTGAATVSANFTVDSSTLFVDSAANTVSLGTTSSAALFTVNGITAMADGQSTPAANANFGKIYVKNDNLYYLPASGSATEFLLNNGSLSVPGANTQVVFNDGGILGADAGFTYIKGTDTLQVDGTINGSTVTADALTITGDSTFTGNLGITGDINMTGDVNLTGDITASATITGLLVQGTTVNGSTVTADALTITGDSTFTGNIGVTGDLDLTGDSTLTGLVDINGATSIIGATSITGATTITGAATVSANFTVDSSTLFVDASANQVGIGTTSTIELLTVNGVTAMAEVSAPTADAGFGKLYVKTDSQLYYMDGSGTEKSLSSNATAISTKITNYTIVSSDYTILGSASSGTITISLPAAASYTGRMFIIKKIDSTANFVTVDPNGAELIDGASTYNLNVQWESIKVQSNGTSWYVL